MSYSEKYLWKEVKIKIDRPIWTKHKDFWRFYELNYWFIPNTKVPDLEEIDAYLLWIDYPLEEFSWVCIAIIKRKNDDDDKLIIVPKWINFTSSEIKKLTYFQEKFFESEIIVEKINI